MEFQMEGLDEVSVAQEMAYGLVQEGVSKGTIRPQESDGVDYKEVRTAADAVNLFDSTRMTSAKAENRDPTDGMFTGAPMYGERRWEYFTQSTNLKSVMAPDGRIGMYSNLHHPGSVKLFEDAFGGAGKALHGRLREGGVLTQEQAKHLFSTSVRASEGHLTKLRADSTDGMRLSEPQHFEIVRLAMKNGGRLPDHLVGAYKSGDMLSFAKAFITHNPSGKELTVGQINERILDASEFVGAEELHKAGLWDAKKVHGSMFTGVTGSGDDAKIGLVTNGKLAYGPAQWAGGKKSVSVSNRNPLNIVTTRSSWSGQTGDNRGFKVFESAAHGFAAGARNIRWLANNGHNTVWKLMHKWAPKGHGNNDPSAYARTVANAMGVSPSAKIDLGDRAFMLKLMKAMARVEAGFDGFKDSDVANGYDMFARNQKGRK